MDQEIGYQIAQGGTDGTTAEERSNRHLAGLNRQRAAMLASKESIQDRLTRESEVLRKMVDELDDSPESKFRLMQQGRLVEKIIEDLNEINARIEQYLEQMDSLVAVREVGEVVEKEHI